MSDAVSSHAGPTEAPQPQPGLTVIFGADHAGYQLKDQLVAHAQAAGINTVDLGANSEESVDYPDFGAAVGRAVAQAASTEPPTLGVCVCGSGIGIAMAAGSVTGVRAATVHSAESAALARQHNDANVACLGARLVSQQTALDAFDAFVNSTFEGGRHIRRVAKLNQLADSAEGGEPT